MYVFIMGVLYKYYSTSPEDVTQERDETCRSSCDLIVETLSFNILLLLVRIRIRTNKNSTILIRIVEFQQLMHG
jgi:hypothetical protein